MWCAGYLFPLAPVNTKYMDYGDRKGRAGNCKESFKTRIFYFALFDAMLPSKWMR
jgi:hypothetical protein